MLIDGQWIGCRVGTRHDFFIDYNLNRRLLLRKKANEFVRFRLRISQLWMRQYLISLGPKHEKTTKTKGKNLLTTSLEKGSWISPCLSISSRLEQLKQIKLTAILAMLSSTWKKRTSPRGHTQPCLFWKRSLVLDYQHSGFCIWTVQCMHD